MRNPDDRGKRPQRVVGPFRGAIAGGIVGGIIVGIFAIINKLF